MARHHRNLDEWEADRGITMGPVHHNTAEAGSLATGKTIIAKAARRSAKPPSDRQKPRPAATD
jgi:hypothetical protein